MTLTLLILEGLNSENVGKMTAALNVGGTSLASERNGVVYLSKTYVGRLLAGQSDTTFIHEGAHLIGMSHRRMDINLHFGVKAALDVSARHGGNLNNPYAYEHYLQVSRR